MRNGAHDPTYAKLLFEYGIFGATAVIALVALGCRRSPAPVRIKAMFFFFWLINGGSLLTTAATTMIYIFLAMWPAERSLPQSAKPLLASKAQP